ncbi:MAG: ABC transporter permease [Candidatus Obscuribacterales bacterium]|nr:ABC transporter permease [Candidatus Obscuribacterales bacterium]
MRLAGEPTPLLVSTPLFVLSAVLSGLMLGTFASSQTVAVQATSTIGFFPCLLLSGFVYPIANIPFPLSLFSVIFPARYYVQLTRDAFVRGADWSEMWPVPLILTTFCAVFLGAAWLSLRRMRTKE